MSTTMTTMTTTTHEWWLAALNIGPSICLCGYEVAEMEEEGNCFEMSEKF